MTSVASSKEAGEGRRSPSNRPRDTEQNTKTLHASYFSQPRKGPVTAFRQASPRHNCGHSFIQSTSECQRHLLCCVTSTPQPSLSAIAHAKMGWSAAATQVPTLRPPIAMLSPYTVDYPECLCYSSLSHGRICPKRLSHRGCPTRDDATATLLGPCVRLLAYDLKLRQAMLCIRTERYQTTAFYMHLYTASRSLTSGQMPRQADASLNQVVVVVVVVVPSRMQQHPDCL